MDIRWMDFSELSSLFSKNKKLRKSLENKDYKYLIFNFGYRESSAQMAVAFDGDDILGVLQLGQNPNDKNEYWMQFVTVHPNHRQKGVANSLVRAAVFYLSKIENAKLQMSSYEPEGEVLIPLIEKIASEFPHVEITHRRWGEPYQNAKKPYIKKDSTVFVEDSNSGFKGWAIAKWFSDFSTPIQVYIKPIDIENADEFYVPLHSITKVK